MATFTNHVMTFFGLKGAGATEKAFDRNTKAANKNEKATRINTRAQQNVGKASAGASRQFGAQAQGLGGLVSVYAGAAANIFAIQQAFAALSRAAQAETVVEGTRTLALEIGASGDEIIENIKRITDSQLTMVEISKEVNSALAAGFGEKQIERITVVAQKASRALGRDLSDAFNRLVRGAGKLEPELLDELGIFARIDPAVEAYAASINRSAASLSNFEKRQAFVNAVIEEGERKFSSINTDTDSAQKSFEQLKVSVFELGLQIGQLLSTALVPIADFFSGTFGNRVGLIGIILLQVFGTARRLIGEFITKQIPRFNAAMDSAIAKRSKLTEADVAGFEKRQKAIVKSLAQRKTGTFQGEGQKDVGAQFRKDISKENLTLQKSKDIQANITKGLKGQVKLRKQLRVELNSNVKTQEEFNKARKASLFQSRALLQTQRLTNDIIAQSGTKANTMAKFLTNAKTAAIGLTAAVGRLVSLMSKLLFGLGVLQAAGSLIFGIDIIEGISDFFESIGAARKQAKEGTIAVVDATKSGVIETQRLTVALQLEQKVRKAIRDEQIKDAESITKTQIAASRDRQVGRKLDINLSSAGTKGRRQIIRTDDPQKNINMVNIEFTKILTKQIEVLEKSRQALIKKRETITGLTEKTEKTVEINNILGKILAKKETITNMNNGTIALGKLIGELAKIAKLPPGVIASLIPDKNIVIDTNKVNLAYKGLTATIGEFVTGKGFTLIKTNKEIKASTIFAIRQVKAFDKAFQSGALSPEKAAAQAGGVVTVINKLLDIIAKTKNAGLGVSKELLAIRDQLVKDTELIKKQSAELTLLEKIGKSIRKTFGSESGIVDNLLASGSVSLEGNFADKSEDRRKNQLKLLSETIRLGEGAVKQEKERIMFKKLASNSDDKAVKALFTQLAFESKLNPLQAERLKNSVLSAKILFGSSFKLRVAAIKLNETEDKRLQKLTGQLSVMKAQNVVAKQQQKIAELQAQNAADSQIRNTELTLQKAINEETAILNDILVSNLETSKSLLEADLQSLTLTQGKKKAMKDVEDSQKRQLLSARILNAESQVDAVELLGPLATKNTAINADLRVAEEQHALALFVINKTKENLEIEKTNSLAQIDLRNDILDKEKAIIDTKILNERDRLATEISNIKTAADNAKLIGNGRLKEIAAFKEQANLVAIAAKEKAIADKANLTAELRIALGRAENIENEALLIEKNKNVFLSHAKAMEEIFGIFDGPGGVEKIFNENIAKSLTLATTARENIVGSIATATEILTSRLAAAESKRTSTTNILSIEERKIIRLAALEAKTAKQQITNAESRSTLTQNQLMKEADVIAIKISHLDLERDTVRANIKAKLQEQGIAKDTAEQAIKLARRRAAVEKDVLFQAYKEITDLVSNRTSQALKDLSNAFIEGTLTMENFKEGFREYLVDLAKGVGEIATNKLIIEPIKELLFGTDDPNAKINSIISGGAMNVKMKKGTSSAATASGLGTTDPGTLLASVITNGAMNVRITKTDFLADPKESGLANSFFGQGIDSAANDDVGFTQEDLEKADDNFSVFADGLAEKGKGFFNNIFNNLGTNGKGFFATMLDGFSGLVDTGSIVFRFLANALRSLMGSTGNGSPDSGSGILGIVAKIGMSVASAYFGGGQTSGFEADLGGSDVDAAPFASGGIVSKFGQAKTVRKFASGGRVRDSIPALLEEGEFVIRRPIAKAMGTQALNKMNAGGSSSSSSKPVQVNITNTGTPQEPEQTTSEEMRDKIIIGVVLRDIENNGALRKGIRAAK